MGNLTTSARPSAGPARNWFFQPAELLQHSGEMGFIFRFSLLMAMATWGLQARAEALAEGKLLSDDAYGKIVKCAARDRAGNLWFATSWAGVFRFDGDSFAHFSRKDGLASDAVNVIFEDNDGVLWFGSDNGVSRYDGRTFSNLPLQAAPGAADFFLRPPPPATSAKNVTSITQDKAGNLWFGLWGAPGDAGAYRYDGKQLVRFLPQYPTQGIVVDNDGGVWLNSKRYDGQMFTDFAGAANVFKDQVFCSLKDRAGNLWFGVRDDGLYRYDGKAFAWFPAKAGSFERVTCLFQDKYGRIWLGGDIRFGTDKGGLARYDGNSFVHFPQVYGLGMYSVWAATEDLHGNLWFGGRGGKLVRYDGKEFVDFSHAIE